MTDPCVTCSGLTLKVRAAGRWDGDRWALPLVGKILSRQTGRPALLGERTEYAKLKKGLRRSKVYIGQMGPE